MATCAQNLDNAKTLVIAAAAAFAAAPIAVLVAIALNGGFFTAPGAPIPMLAAGAAAIAAGALLKKAFDLLQQMVRDGCIARECEGKLANINNALAAAITTVGLLAAASFGVAAVAWIPWFTQPAMWAVYIPMTLAALSLGTLAVYWAPLSECQQHVATSRGPLMAGEKASDPWFLRIKPRDPPHYENPIESTALAKKPTNSQWLDCTTFEVREWEVSAIAYIIGAPAAPVAFTWNLAGSTVSASNVQVAGSTATVAVKSPPLPATVKLTVKATDAGGYSRSISVDVNLGTEAMKCNLILHFVPPMFDPPRKAPDPIEITPEMENFLRALRGLMQGSAQARLDIRDGGDV
jgi:hypothetical protein